MVNLLLPGRQLVTTSFQEECIKDILSKNIKDLDLYNKRAFKDKKINKIIFALTSFNQDNSRYNPISFYHRFAGVDRFCQEFKKSFNIKYLIFGIPHYHVVANFPDMINKEISSQSEGDLKITHENTIVFCSTPALIKQYKKSGFAILTGEYDVKKKKNIEMTPQEVVSSIFENFDNKQKFNSYLKKLSFANLSLWNDYSVIAKKVARIWKDPLLTDSGSLTETRNYSTYITAMSRMSVINLKYNDIKHLIKEGKIVDEGCADGALLSLIAKDFPDSDLLGIEITSEFLAQCYERLRRGSFGKSYIHFYQRNLLDKIFSDESIDTVICNSTTHEIWSYGKGRSSLVSYLNKKHKQLRKGGRLIVRDVVGPEKKNKTIFMKFNNEDGHNNPINSSLSLKKFQDSLEKASTFNRFMQFTKDYLDIKSSRKTNLKYSFVTINGEKYVKISLKNACEFITKKDYTDNWKSEMNEEFAFWNFNDWKKELEKIGFNVLEGKGNSRTYINDWILNNRYKGKIELYEKNNGILKPIKYPVTNIILVAEKN